MSASDKTTSRASSEATLAATGAEQKGRAIVLCFDGTSNTFGKKVTNVPMLYSLVAVDPEEQLLYYQTGVGTYSPYWSPTGFMKGISQIADFGVAWDLDNHVQDGYTYLMNTYKPGDRIYLFGFSRGSYSCRALAGLVQQVGLLLPQNKESVSLAFSIYKRRADTPFVRSVDGSPAITLAGAFKRDFSREVPIHFIGVWDTVASVGAIIPRTLPFSAGNRHITYFRHAMSLDERRVRFDYQPWIVDTSDTPSHYDSEDRHGIRGGDIHMRISDVKEVYFSGCHSDVGGGDRETDDGRYPRTSNIPLRWMVREAMNKGLRFDEKRVLSSLLYSPIVKSVANRIDTKDPKVMRYLQESPAFASGTQSQLLVAVIEVASREYSQADAIAPRHDALSFWMAGGGIFLLFSKLMQIFETCFWWILEIFPTLKFVWSVSGTVKDWSMVPNFGRGRLLVKSPVMHESVKVRMGTAKSDFPPGDGSSVPETGHYKPKARFQKGDSWETVEWTT